MSGKWFSLFCVCRHEIGVDYDDIEGWVTCPGCGAVSLVCYEETYCEETQDEDQYFWLESVLYGFGSTA